MNDPTSEVKALYQRGLTVKEVAVAFGLSAGIVRAIVKPHPQQLTKARIGLTALQKALRASERYEEWRKAVFVRDRFTCQHCGKRNGRKRIIQADHIYPFSALIRDNKITSVVEGLNCKGLWDVENGRTLCKVCHEKTDTYPTQFCRRK